MCNEGKCLYCIPVEIGCLVFAILSAIATLLMLLGTLIVGLLIIAGVIITSHEVTWNDDESERERVAQGIALSVIALISSIPFLIAFIFSVLLCNGICKRRPGQVRTYFMFGVVITVLAVVVSIIAVITSNVPYLGLMGLAGCVFYSLILWMVFETYLKLSAGAVYMDHVRLVEN